MPRLPRGYSVVHVDDVDETEDAITTVPATLFGWVITNQSAGDRFVRFYDATVATVVVGTTAPLLTISVPTLEGVSQEFVGGIIFGTAITVACTTGSPDDDTGAPGADDCAVSALYLTGTQRQG